MSCSLPCPAPVQSMPPGSPPPSAQIAVAGSLPMNWSASPASLQSSSAAANSSASVGATSVPSSFAKPFMSLPPNRSRTLSGPALTTSASAPKAKTITPPSAPWPSNGSGSSGSAGTLALPTTRSSIWRACGRRVRRCSSSPLTINSESLLLNATSFFLTCHPQLSSTSSPSTRFLIRKRYLFTPHDVPTPIVANKNLKTNLGRHRRSRIVYAKQVPDFVFSGGKNRRLSRFKCLQRHERPQNTKVPHSDGRHFSVAVLTPGCQCAVGKPVLVVVAHI